MRTFRYIAILAITSLLTVSCFTEVENELSALERRVENLNKKLAIINENTEALQKMVDKYNSYVYVTSYRPVYSGKDIVGYTILFSDGTSITLNNGVSKDDPIVGLKLGEDGMYYWIVTVNGKTEFIYDETGQKVAATVASPIMKIVDGVWQVSFDNGYIWQTFDKAQAADGKSFVDSMVTRGNYVYLYLISGKTVSFPLYSLYEEYVSQLNSLNANIEALKQVYRAKESNNYVKNVVPIVQDKDTVGYSLVFSDNTTVTAYNGKPAEGQQITIAQYTDGAYYWAIVDGDKVEWLYDDLDRMVQASPTEGLTPIFMLDNSSGDGKYYWAYKYGEKGVKMFLYDKDGKKVVASDANVIQLFSKVEIKDNYVLFTPVSGSAFSVPRYVPFTVVLSATSVNVPASGEAVKVTYELRSVPSTAAITAIADTGYHASVTRKYDSAARKLSGTISITAEPTAPAKSTLLVMVSDGNGNIETYRISLTKK
ncbi:MAG: hypothetical protein J5639_04500 [Bacteroidales bacterium]|nr:hypothetical protein [Bacteroidales bacterium]